MKPGKTLRSKKKKDSQKVTATNNKEELSELDSIKKLPTDNLNNLQGKIKKYDNWISKNRSKKVTLALKNLEILKKKSKELKAENEKISITKTKDKELLTYLIYLQKFQPDYQHTEAGKFIEQEKEAVCQKLLVIEHNHYLHPTLNDKD